MKSTFCSNWITLTLSNYMRLMKVLMNCIWLWNYVQAESYTLAWWSSTVYVTRGIYPCVDCRFNEEEIRLIMRKLLSAVNYLHEKHIAHRDLKYLFLTIKLHNRLSNILYKNKLSSELKLIDFGLSKVWCDLIALFNRSIWMIIISNLWIPSSVHLII